MRKENGFTLIELVMVIVIIGILAAVALPRFVSLKADAQKATCDGNIGAIRGALSAYYAKASISPAWATGKAASGFPASLTDTQFIDCFIQGGALPICPKDGNSTAYTTLYNSTTGQMLPHTH